MIEQVILSIEEAEEKAERLIAEAKDQARQITLSAKQQAEKIQENAEEASAKIRAEYRQKGDRFGRRKGEEIVRIRKAEFETAIADARGRIELAVDKILERIEA